jgi:hypothetical protein
MKKTLFRAASVLLAVTLVLGVLSGGAMAFDIEENQVNYNDQDTKAVALSANYGSGAALSYADADSDSKQLNFHYEDD